jgi:hypothetical protein
VDSVSRRVSSSSSVQRRCSSLLFKPNWRTNRQHASLDRPVCRCKRRTVQRSWGHLFAGECGENPYLFPSPGLKPPPFRRRAFSLLAG